MIFGFLLICRASGSLRLEVFLCPQSSTAWPTPQWRDRVSGRFRIDRPASDSSLLRERSAMRRPMNSPEKQPAETEEPDVFGELGREQRHQRARDEHQKRKERTDELRPMLLLAMDQQPERGIQSGDRRQMQAVQYRNGV